MQPLGDGFIKLVKMLIAPIVFTTVVVGHRADGRDEGRRPDRTARDRVLRGRLAAGAGHRPGRRHGDEAWQRRRFRSGDRRPQLDRGLHGDRAAAPAAPSSSCSTSFRTRSSARSRGATSCRCCCSPCSFGARAAADWASARSRLVEIDGAGVGGAVRRGRHHHAAGADRRVRRDGVHGRALRHRVARRRSGS